MSSDVDNSQAVRDAERAANDLAEALRVGATLVELDQLMTAKANADDRVASLRRRVEPLSGNNKSRQASADLLERRQRRRAEAQAKTGEQNRPT
ncbi:MAG TPA: hypothetical protein VGL75_05385 [Acidothermaceae bacterium]|jgi:hypothetical protein